MGLFGGSNKVCPVCGSPSMKFLSTKVEGEPLCSDCERKAVFLPPGYKVKKMSAAQVREFVSVYDENADLRSIFQESFKYKFGFLGGEIILDAANRLMRFSNSDEAIVYEAARIKSFCISEDSVPLFEGTKEALLCHQSNVPDRVRNLGPEINRYLMDKQQYEQMKNMEEILKKQAEQAGKTYSSNYYPSPDVDRLKPFGAFRVTIEVDHPFLSQEMYTQGAPGFSSYTLSITDYLNDYEEKVGVMRNLATQLMTVLNPDAPVSEVAAKADSGVQAASTVSGTSDASVDAVAEIQKYKGLLDSGAITEEEFTAKKRQLLGI